MTSHNMDRNWHTGALLAPWYTQHRRHHHHHHCFHHHIVTRLLSRLSRVDNKLTSGSSTQSLRWKLEKEKGKRFCKEMKSGDIGNSCFTEENIFLIISNYGIIELLRIFVWSNRLREGVKKTTFFFGRSLPSLFTYPPTPGFLWDLGYRKVKFGSKRRFSGWFGGILRCLDLVWKLATPPTYIWERSSKKYRFFTPSLTSSGHWTKNTPIHHH